MTPEDVYQLVLAEIGESWDTKNLHGVTPRKNLLDAPRRIQMLNAVGSQKLVGWVVLTEEADFVGGYAVVYSESDKQFGLVLFVEGYEPCLIGIYGDFWSTFHAM